jgi:hypothetical protein
VLNLYGVALELGGDISKATQAYRAAFACDQGFGRARRNLERLSDQFAFLGLLDDARLDFFQASALRLAVPLFDPVRDLPLVRLAKVLGGPSCAVAVGVVFDPPTEEEGESKTIARRRGFIRAAGRHDRGSVPCVVDYAFAVDRVAAARALRDEERCKLTVLGVWAPESVRAAFVADEEPVLLASAGELPDFEAVQPELTGPHAPLALGLAVNAAVGAHALLLLPSAIVEALRATSVPVHAVYAQAKLAAPPGVPSEVYVSVRAGEPPPSTITIGSAETSTLRIV